MKKEKFTEIIKDWLERFLINKFGNSWDVDVIIPQSFISKLNNNLIKSIANYSSWDFKPDVLGILSNKKNKQVRLVFLNRSTSALSLKEFGEINLYAKLADAELAFLASTNGLSNEVSILLLDNNIQDRLLKFSEKKRIIIFSWDSKKSTINPNSIMPLEEKNLLI